MAAAIWGIFPHLPPPVVRRASPLPTARRTPRATGRGRRVADLDRARFGDLVVIGPPRRWRARMHWPCRCVAVREGGGVCGAKVLIRSNALTSGDRWCCNLFRCRGAKAAAERARRADKR